MQANEGDCPNNGWEVRGVIRSRRSPEDRILLPTRSHQKVHLISHDSGELEVGFATAKLIRDHDRCAIYQCRQVPTDRMVVKAILADDQSMTYVERNGEHTTFWGVRKRGLEPYAESITESYFVDDEYIHSRSHREWLILITKGKEDKAMEALQPYVNDNELAQFQCGHVEWVRPGVEHGNLCSLCTEEVRRNDAEMEQMMADWPEPPEIISSELVVELTYSEIANLSAGDHDEIAVLLKDGVMSEVDALEGRRRYAILQYDKLPAWLRRFAEPLDELADVLGESDLHHRTSGFENC